MKTITTEELRNMCLCQSIYGQQEAGGLTGKPDHYLLKADYRKSGI